MSTIFLLSMNTKEKTGFVDAQKLFEEFQGKKERDAKFQSMKQSAKSSMDSMTVELKKLPEGSEQYRQLYMQIAGNQAQIQKKLEEKLNEYNEEILRQINQYVYDYGMENKFDYIFGAAGNGSLMYSNSTNDLTDKVLQYINKRYNGQ